MLDFIKNIINSDIKVLIFFIVLAIIIVFGIIIIVIVIQKEKTKRIQIMVSVISPSIVRKNIDDQFNAEFENGTIIDFAKLISKMKS